MFVAKVEQPAHERGPGSAADGFIDMPKVGTRIDGAGYLLVGWALGKEAPAVSIELVRDDEVFRRLQLDQERPDLDAAFPDDPRAGTSGFRALLPTFGFDELDLEVRAVLAGGTRASIGTLALRRASESDRDGTPLVSVIIPCFNQAHYLEESIESALGQTHGHLEVVVVDDGSSDNTGEVARRYPGLTVVRQDNRGLAVARNVGLEASRGEYVVFLDADDLLRPHAVASGLAVLEAEPSCALAVGRFDYMDAQGEPLPTPRWADPGREHFAALLRANYVGPPASALHRRSALEEVGGFDVGLRAAEDYDLYLRIACTRAIRAHNPIVANYRLHGRSMSRDPALMLDSVLRVLRRQRRAARRAGLGHAYRDGIRFWRRYYGEPLIDSIRAHRAAGERRAARRELRVLLLRDPMTRGRLALGLRPVWASDPPLPARRRQSDTRQRRRRDRSGAQGVVLLYHRIGEPGPDPWSLAVRPQRFAEHLQTLRAVGRPASLSELGRACANGKSEGKPLIAVTFDDGYADNFHVAKPLLDQHDVPATVFVTTGYIDSPLPFWWDELTMLLLADRPLPERLTLTVEGEQHEWETGTTGGDHAANRRAMFDAVWSQLVQLGQVERQAVLDEIRELVGATGGAEEIRPLTWSELIRLADGELVQVGAHTVMHPRLSARPPAEQEAEIGESRTALERALGMPITSFAYPYGGPTDFTAETVAIVERLKFERAFATTQGVVGAGIGPFSLPRLHVHDWDGEELVRQVRALFDNRS